MLKSESGKEKLAYLIHTISFLLNKVADIGALYGNLRTENIILILDKQNTKILDIRFLGFGSITYIEESDEMHIPEQIDHLPPLMTSYLLKCQRFSKKCPNAINYA